MNNKEENKIIGNLDAKKRKRVFVRKPVVVSKIRYWRHPLLIELWGINEEVKRQEEQDSKRD